MKKTADYMATVDLLTSRGIVPGARVRYRSLSGVALTGTVDELYGRKTIQAVVDGTAISAADIIEVL